MEIDEVDYRLLKTLQVESRTPLRELARVAGVSIPTARSRVERLKRLGVIKRFTTAINPDSLVHGITAVIGLKVRLPELRNITQSLTGMEEVSEVYVTSGENDLMIKISVPDIRALDDFVVRKLSSIAGVEYSRNSIIVETVKEQFGPTLRPGFGVKIFCNECSKRITEDWVKREFDRRERYFCCETCASTYQARFQSSLTATKQ